MSYKEFAQVYDALMTHAPYDKWVSFTEEIIEKYNENLSYVLDLGCGTGEITLRLAKKGYSVSGVDISADMLTQASMKANQEQLNISWVHQDIKQLDGFINVDLCISYCDVINYVTNQEDVKNVFQNVYDSLTKNGLFIFDVHDYQYAYDKLINHTFAEVTDELSYIWECESGLELGEMHHYLTFFAQNKDLYTRFDEVHHQRVYPTNEYEYLLEQCGFTNIEVYQDFNISNHKTSNQAERIFIVAQKQ